MLRAGPRAGGTRLLPTQPLQAGLPAPHTRHSTGSSRGAHGTAPHGPCAHLASRCRTWCKPRSPASVSPSVVHSGWQPPGPWRFCTEGRGLAGQTPHRKAQPPAAGARLGEAGLGQGAGQDWGRIQAGIGWDLGKEQGRIWEGFEQGRIRAASRAQSEHTGPIGTPSHGPRAALVTCESPGPWAASRKAILQPTGRALCSLTRIQAARNHPLPFSLQTRGCSSQSGCGSRGKLRQLGRGEEA